METQKLVILGASGNVGTELIRQFAHQKQAHPERNGVDTNLVGMADSSGWLYEPRGIDLQFKPGLVEHLQSQDRGAVEAGRPRGAMKSWMRGRDRYIEGGDLRELFQEVVRQGLEHDVVFIDLTASDLTHFHESVISYGGRIVTANKIPVASASWDVFKILAGLRRRYGYRCSVMAGAEAVPFLQDSFEIGDEVQSIEGCFSGTLGKLCTLLHEGEVTFSQAIRKLKVDGDTEPDPRVDLSGQDVARKIVILARSAGYPVNLEDVKVEPFIAGGFRELSDCDVTEFLERADIFNAEIAAQFDSAKKQGKTLRYVASLKVEDGKPVVTLGLREEPLDSPLGSLRGNGNKVIIYTATHQRPPHEISAPGSGIILTAKNIRRDLLNVARAE